MKLEAKQRLQAANKKAFKEIKTKLSALFKTEPKLVWTEKPLYVVWDDVAPSTSSKTGKDVQEFMNSAEITKKLSEILGLKPAVFSKPHRILKWVGEGWTVCWNGHNRGVELDGAPDEG